jgi:hypothetical protein
MALNASRSQRAEIVLPLILALLESYAKDSPLVVMIDDAQHMDLASWDLMTRISALHEKAAKDFPIFTVISWQSTLDILMVGDEDPYGQRETPALSDVTDPASLQLDPPTQDCITRSASVTSNHSTSNRSLLPIEEQVEQVLIHHHRYSSTLSNISSVSQAPASLVTTAIRKEKVERKCRYDELCKSPYTTRTTLKELCREDVERLAEGKFDADSISPALAEFLFKSSRGNPFFVEQLLLQLDEDELLRLEEVKGCPPSLSKSTSLSSSSSSAGGGGISPKPFNHNASRSAQSAVTARTGGDDFQFESSNTTLTSDMESGSDLLGDLPFDSVRLVVDLERCMTWIDMRKTLLEEAEMDDSRSSNGDANPKIRERRKSFLKMMDTVFPNGSPAGAGAGTGEDGGKTLVGRPSLTEKMMKEKLQLEREQSGGSSKIFNKKGGRDSNASLFAGRRSSNSKPNFDQGGSGWLSNLMNNSSNNLPLSSPEAYSTTTDVTLQERWVLGELSELMTPPPSIQGVLQSKLDELTVPMVMILRVGATLGFSFKLKLLKLAYPIQSHLEEPICATPLPQHSNPLADETRLNNTNPSNEGGRHRNLSISGNELTLSLFQDNLEKLIELEFLVVGDEVAMMQPHQPSVSASSAAFEAVDMPVSEEAKDERRRNRKTSTLNINADEKLHFSSGFLRQVVLCQMSSLQKDCLKTRRREAEEEIQKSLRAAFFKEFSGKAGEDTLSLKKGWLQVKKNNPSRWYTEAISKLTPTAIWKSRYVELLKNTIVLGHNTDITMSSEFWNGIFTDMAMVSSKKSQKATGTRPSMLGGSHSNSNWANNNGKVVIHLSDAFARAPNSSEVPAQVSPHSLPPSLYPPHSLPPSFTTVITTYQTSHS